jgi:hypothetical protein
MSDQGISEADLDGDGVKESVLIDSDGDGAAETIVDHDSSGQLEVTSDDSGDGVYDTISNDSDGDGFLDTTASDLDGDGTVDVIEFDVDGDGQTDVIDVAGQSLILDETGHVVAVVADPAVGPDSTTDPSQTDPSQTDPSQTDPSQTDPSQTDPMEDDTADPDTAERADDAQYWIQQSENGFCAPSSVAMIVAEYTDQPMDQTVFEQRAVDLGYLTYDEAGGTGWSGMTVEQPADLLESFGVPATVQTGTVDGLDELLDQGYNAIVAIDSSEIWTGDGTGAADHAVVVSSIEDGMVYLEDPGTPDGRLEPVPVDVFEQAWSASGDQMVLTENPDTGDPSPEAGPDVFVPPSTGDTDEESDTSGLGAAVGSSRGTVLVPVVLAGEAVRAWHQLNG